MIALFDGFTIERLADPDAALDDVLAHAVAATLRGFTSGPTYRSPTAWGGRC